MAFTIPDISGEYDQLVGEHDKPASIILYSEQDATGGTRGGYRVLEWALTDSEDGFEVKLREPGIWGKTFWLAASSITSAGHDGGRVSDFELVIPKGDGSGHERASFYRANRRHFRPAPGTTVKGNVTLTFH